MKLYIMHLLTYVSGLSPWCNCIAAWAEGNEITKYSKYAYSRLQING